MIVPGLLGVPVLDEEREEARQAVAVPPRALDLPRHTSIHPKIRSAIGPTFP